MTTRAEPEPQTVHLLFEVPAADPAVAVRVDGAAPVLDEMSGAASGSGWRLFEQVPGEVPPWLPFGELDGDRYRQHLRLPDRGGPVELSATCQISVAWTAGPDGEQLTATLDRVIAFVLPTSGVHTVTGALHYIAVGPNGRQPWRLSLR